MRAIFASASERLVSLTHNIAALLLAIATFLVFVQVVSRFGFGHSIAWTEIAARGLVIWMVFMVMAAGFRFSAMIPLEFIRDVSPPAVRVWVMRIVLLLTLVFLFVLAWYGTMMAIRVNSQKIAMLNVPMSWFYASIPVGAVLAVPGVLLGHFAPRELDRGLPE